MIDAAEVDAIVEQYSKHGWTVRCVLVTTGSAEELGSRFVNFEIRPSEIDAIWFSRINGSSETWELRRLTGSPFALLQSIDSGISPAARDELLHDIESRMAGTLLRSVGENSSEK